MHKKERIKKKNYYDVVPAYNIDRTLCYSSEENLKPGNIVVFTIRKKTIVGCILKKLSVKPFINSNIKDILEVSKEFYLNKAQIDFLKWFSTYNACNLGLAFKMILSKKTFLKPIVANCFIINEINLGKLTKKEFKFLNSVKKTKNFFFNTYNKKIYSKTFISQLIKKNIISKVDKKQSLGIKHYKSKLKVLSDQQTIAYKKILFFFKNKKNKPIFLDGITSSGKTEVYFKVIKKIIDNKQQVLVLIPEIALSKQWLNRFIESFGFEPLIWNSKVKSSKKKEVWQACIKGETVVVVGARSSIFLPFLNLGLIVVDEENDTSYKQEDNTIYNARDMAIIRSKINNSEILLVSATPSLETYQNCILKKYETVYLNTRFGIAESPKINLIDMKKKASDVFALQTQEILKEKIKSGKQVLILINKRGFAPITICSKCGAKETCSNCDINLVYHKKKNRLVCHHCGESKKILNNCLKCKSKNTKISLGFGIEKVTEKLSKLFENEKIISLSSDNIDHENFNRILEQIEEGSIKIIVGTQIISKGFDFKKLNSVFILDFDMWLYNSDIRTNEKIFQLTQQVSGRTSRMSETGEVFIQTYDENNYLLKALQSNNRNLFYENELIMRKKVMLPPYYKLVSIILLSKDISFLKKISIQIKIILEKYKEFKTLGPIPAPIEFIRKEYRYRILIKTNRAFYAQNIVKSINFRNILKNKAKVKIDVDPISFF